MNNRKKKTIPSKSPILMNTSKKMKNISYLYKNNENEEYFEYY